MINLKQIEYMMRTNFKSGYRKIYLFLDFDGVINVFYMPGTPEYEKKLEESKESFEFADHDAVQRLNALSRDFPISVVISSSWRFGTLKSCTEYLEKAGLSSQVTIAGTTQTDHFQTREEDIQQYLLEHPDFTGFIIFDDGAMPSLSDYLVQTNPLKGWDKERDIYARDILKKFWTFNSSSV